MAPAALFAQVCVRQLGWRASPVLLKARFGQNTRLQPSSFLDNRICLFGVWEPTLTFINLTVLKNGRVFIDVGANIGYCSLLASSLVGSEGRVYAIEPVVGALRRLKENVHLNKISNISVISCAAWNEDGVAYLSPTGVDHSHASLDVGDGNRIGSAENAAERVELRRIDGVIPTSEKRPVRLIKIDVEGAEFQAIDGLRGFLDKDGSCTMVLCEISSDRLDRFGTSLSAIWDCMTALGYSGFVIHNDYSLDSYLERRVNVDVEILHKDTDRQVDVLFLKSQSSSRVLELLTLCDILSHFGI
jgi:FkbM family methyltransferase